MARKQWTQSEIDELETRIRDKIQRKEPLTCGEDTLWGVLKHGKPLTARLVYEVDFYMGIDD